MCGTDPWSRRREGGRLSSDAGEIVRDNLSMESFL